MSGPKASSVDATVISMAPAISGFRLRIMEARDASLVGLEFTPDAACLVGRAEECDVVIRDASISRRHARLDATALGVRITDQKSANGTWVGAKRVESALLDHMDRFRLGNVVLELVRDDEEGSADDLDAARTTSIPIREIVESLQLRLTTTLEQEGEAVVMSGNKPFLIADSAFFWLVEEGRVDIFTVTVNDGEPSGARAHFISVDPGHVFFGMDLAAYGMGGGFLATGKSGTRLRKIPVARLRVLAADPGQAPRIAGLVDGWVVGLSEALVRGLPAVSPDFDLEPGEETILGAQKRARAGKGVVWVPLHGTALFIGLSEISGAPLFPITREGWIEANEEPLILAPVGTRQVAPGEDLWEGLDLYHRVLCECEFLNKRLATVDEFNRLKSKAEHAVAAQEAAYEEIGGVLANPEKKAADVFEGGDVEPVYQACRFVCAALGMEAKKPSDARAERAFEDNLQAVAISSRFRTRMVALRGDWWKEDQGPFLAKTEEGKQPVALIPRGPSAYDWVDAKTGKSAPVDAAFVKTLNPFAYVFYRRLPDGLITAKDIVMFGARGMKRDVLTLVAMGLALGVLGSMAPYFTGRLFDSAIPQAEKSLLAQFTIALFVSAIASTAFNITQSIAVLRVQGKMDYAIQAALWDRLLDLPSTFFKQYTSGDLADRAGGVDAIRALLAGAGIGAILGTLSSIFYVVLMLSYSVSLAMLAIVLTFIFLGFTTTANFLQLRFQRQQMGMRGAITGLVVQLITGVGKLRVCGAEPHGFRVWARAFAEQRRVAFRAGQVQNAVGVFNSAFPLFASISTFATLVYVQKSAGASGGAGGLSTGDFIAFSAAFGLFLAAMQSLSEASLSLLKAVPIWERLSPILTTAPEIDDSKTPPPRLRGEIEISHVWFRYSENTPYILKDLTLKISAGQFVAFVGGSGSGKSTLMRLMLGFEKPEKGTIYYDGQDLSTLDLRLVRQQLGVVLQDSRVLPADIYRNIVGSSSRSVDDAWTAAEKAGLAEDVRAMPMGMHTYVSEGGGGFSGGQKQRLMIARAVVGAPKILFLDEATSALDNRTQAIVTESMNKMHATRIVIAHRLSTIVNADVICYLEGGAVKESGTHEELMKQNGLFSELARRQMA
ncbi:MAG: NHLP bacteriocin export ABC transporter permease/ATPase subunit [Acidobacteriota bacterium]|nr:NHLP bacteriocin export ABC transporter permease/ATPase subunit [Acidobacteriota bacterium]